MDREAFLPIYSGQSLRVCDVRVCDVRVCNVRV